MCHILSDPGSRFSQPNTFGRPPTAASVRVRFVATDGGHTYTHVCISFDWILHFSLLHLQGIQVVQTILPCEPLMKLQPCSPKKLLVGTSSLITFSNFHVRSLSLHAPSSFLYKHIPERKELWRVEMKSDSGKEEEPFYIH